MSSKRSLRERILLVLLTSLLSASCITTQAVGCNTKKRHRFAPIDSVLQAMRSESTVFVSVEIRSNADRHAADFVLELPLAGPDWAQSDEGAGPDTYPPVESAVGAEHPPIGILRSADSFVFPVDAIPVSVQRLEVASPDEVEELLTRRIGDLQILELTFRPQVDQGAVPGQVPMAPGELTKVLVVDLGSEQIDPIRLSAFYEGHGRQWDGTRSLR